jgi:hypothetical protein
MAPRPVALVVALLQLSLLVRTGVATVDFEAREADIVVSAEDVILEPSNISVSALVAEVSGARTRNQP